MADALEEALCFGWINFITQKIGDERRLRGQRLQE
jgi:hypothetical protein